MHIVITRPKEDSFYLIEKLLKLEHMVTHLPVMKIKKLETKKINLQNYKAVIFTSSNAIKFINLGKFDSKIKCFCVGSSTEKKARGAGFQNVFAADGNVNNLKEWIIQNFNSSLIEEIKIQVPEIVYIYSQNSAISFLDLIRNNQLETLWMNTNLMCIGEKVSSILNEIKWKKIFLFNPGEEEFLLYKI